MTKDKRQIFHSAWTLSAQNYSAWLWCYISCYMYSNISLVKVSYFTGLLMLYIIQTSPFYPLKIYWLFIKVKAHHKYCTQRICYKSHIQNIEVCISYCIQFSIVCNWIQSVKSCERPTKESYLMYTSWQKYWWKLEIVSIIF